MRAKVTAEWPPPYKVARTIEDAERCARWIGTNKPVLAIDTESAGLNWWRDPMRLMQLSDGKTTWVVPAHNAGPVVDRLAKYLSGRTKTPRKLAFANAKYDTHVLQAHTGLVLPWEPLLDIQAAAAALFPGEPKGLKDLGEEYVDPMGAILGKWLYRIFADNGWARDSKKSDKPLGWAHIPWDNEVYLAYAAWDAWATASMAPDFDARMDKDQRSVYELDRGVTGVLHKMETRGTRIDRAYCASKAEELTDFIDQATKSILERYGVRASSDAEVAAFLESQGVVLPTTETGKSSVAADALAECPHPVAQEILAVRHSDKFRSYFLGMLNNAGAGDIMHPSINPIGARTGRMSCSDPPLQQLPRKRLIRDAVIPRDGNLLAKCDFDQIEMRLMAHFVAAVMGDTTMLDAIKEGDRLAAAGKKGYDLHSMNARAVYGISLDDVVPKLYRSLAKNGGFAEVYEAGPARFAATINSGLPPDQWITVEDAQQFKVTFNETFPGIRPFKKLLQQTAKRRLREDGRPWIKAQSGRTHVAPRGKCDEHGKGQCAMSCSSRPWIFYPLTNYLIQGTAADVFKQALIRMDVAGLADQLILPVHDEAIADVPEADAQDYVEAMGDVLSDRSSWLVPLTADGKLVDRWGVGYE